MDILQQIFFVERRSLYYQCKMDEQSLNALAYSGQDHSLACRFLKMMFSKQVSNHSGERASSYLPELGEGIHLFSYFLTS